MVDNLKNMLTQNELRIFKAVYETGPVSRVKVARGLNLTRATVSNIINRLTDLNLIVEVGKGAASKRRGRREVLLVVNPDAGFILTIHIALSYATIAIVNLNGRVVTKKTHTYNVGSPPQEVLEIVVDIAHNLMSEINIDKTKIYGAGISIPGIINYADGIVREKTLPGWQGFAIKAYLEEKLDYNVLLENDVKTIALGEFQFGTARDVRDMVCLWLEDGIGAGIINEGRLIRGVTASAGEIGFNEFVLELPVKRSILIESQPKCWGDILSFSNIKATIKRGLDEGWKTELNNNVIITDFAKAVDNNDPLAMYIFRLMSKILGIVSVNIIYSFNPQVLLLSGPLFYKIPRLGDEVRSYLHKAVLRSPIEVVELKTSILGEDGILAGGAALVLENLFKASEHKSMH